MKGGNTNAASSEDDNYLIVDYFIPEVNKMLKKCKVGFQVEFQMPCRIIIRHNDTEEVIFKTSSKKLFYAFLEINGVLLFLIEIIKNHKQVKLLENW